MSTIEVVSRFFQAEKEVTYRTNPTPVVGTDDILARDIKYDPKIGRAQLPRVGAKPIAAGSVISSLSDGLEVEFDMVGMANSPLTVARWTRFLEACGMAVAGTGGPPVNTQTFTWSSRTSLASLTVLLYMFATGSKSAVQHTITGLRAVHEIAMAVDNTITCKFSCEGYHAGQADVDLTSSLGSIAYDAVALVAQAAKNVTFEIDSNTANCKKFTLKSGRELNRVDTICDNLAVGKINAFLPTGKCAELSVDLEMQLLADFDHWTNLLSNTDLGWSLSWQCPNGSIVTITGAVGGLRLKEFKHENDGSIVRINCTFEVLGSSAGDDDYTITFTKAP